MKKYYGNLGCGLVCGTKSIAVTPERKILYEKVYENRHNRNNLIEILGHENADRLIKHLAGGGKVFSVLATVLEW